MRFELWGSPVMCSCPEFGGFELIFSRVLINNAFLRYDDYIYGKHLGIKAKIQLSLVNRVNYTHISCK